MPSAEESRPVPTPGAARAINPFTTLSINAPRVPTREPIPSKMSEIPSDKYENATPNTSAAEAITSIAAAPIIASGPDIPTNTITPASAAIATIPIRSVLKSTLVNAWNAFARTKIPPATIRRESAPRRACGLPR